MFSGFDYTDLSNHLVGTLDEYLLWPPVALCHVIQEPLYNNKTLVKLHKYQCTGYNMYTRSNELHEFKILSNVEIFTLWTFLQFVYENLTKILLKMKIPKHFLFYMILSSHILCQTHIQKSNSLLVFPLLKFNIKTFFTNLTLSLPE